MTPARLQTIEEIYRAALDQEPDQISAFLDTACEGDEALRRKVEALLASRERAGSFIEKSAVGLAAKIIQNGRGDSLVGQTIGHYRISESIGTGGMGDVYLATDITAGRKAALKLLPMRFTGDAERLKRFQQEAHAVVALNHPNILTVYEVGEDHSIHYIASELIEGETLRQHLMRGRMELSEAVDIAIQVASALAAAHEAGIVHRDIKPENIMLRPDGYVKVLDFGIAKLAEQEVPATTPRDEALFLVETNLGSILGTARYMSPEQACGGQVDKSTDIWSLGVVLYEMVSGHVAFTGDTPGEVMSAILEREPPPLASYNKHPPAELQQIISKTLRKDRKKRYRSAHDLLKALKDLRRNLEFESFFMSGFFDEVKRRKVYRVAAAYIIAAAGIIQLSSVAFPAWDLPNWALRVVIVLLLIGFPLALVLGWVFDLTSQGIRATPGWHRRRSVIMLVAPGVIISAAAGFFLLPRVSAYKVDKSIAVLPLENLSEDKENAFFADGVQDELLSNLAKIKDLKVISRTSVMQYKSGIKRNLKEIGQQLGVGNVVEGRVRRSGDHVRVSMQLTDARTDRHLWGENYDRTVADSVALQGDLATEIAAAVGAALSPQEKARVVAKPTNNPEAYDAYLRGLAFEARSNPSLEAASFYEQAVQLDPNFAVAWARLSRMDAHLSFDQSYSTPGRGDAAKGALENAQKLEPNSPETLLALGYYQYWVLRDNGQAKTTFERVSKMLPNSSEVPRALGTVTRWEGHWDESIAYFEQALALDPRDVDLLTEAALTYVMLRQFPAALKLYDRALDIMPNDPEAMAEKARIYQAQGNLQEAARLLAKINEQTPNWEAIRIKITQLSLERNYGEAVRLLRARLAQFHYASDYEKTGDQLLLARMQRLTADSASAKANAEEARNRLESWYKDQPSNTAVTLTLAWAHAALGERALALKEVERVIMLYPSAKNPVNGPSHEENRALIQTIFGDSRAIPTLRQLLQTPYIGGAYYPAPITAALLRLDPFWDPLRADPAFQELCEEKKP